MDFNLKMYQGNNSQKIKVEVEGQKTKRGAWE
jgi:hypothetical protein